ncbi:MAG: polyisoprenoid-binding protein YceI [Spirosomataceae bacterium]|jgi:polyisoprenoid-binding protein YceI
MKKTMIAFALLATTFATSAQTWTVDKAHSGVKFEITHMMLSDVSGKFKNYDATFTSAKEDFSDAKFSFAADISSVDTDNTMRDGHLQGDSWFDAAKNPKMIFTSTSFIKLSGNKYKMMGNLTMKGKTALVALDVTLNGPVTDQRSGKKKVGIKAMGIVDRTKWGVGGEGNVPVSEELSITAAGEFIGS